LRPMAGFEVTTSAQANRTVVALAGECDLSVSGELTSALLGALGEGREVVVDLAALQFLDSSGVHGLVTASVEGGATVRTGGDFEGLFYRPTVLGDVPVDAPAYQEEIFGPVAPVTPFSSVDEVVALAAGTEYGLSLGILTRDVYAGLQLAERIPSGLVHINDQTVNDEAVAPFGGVGASGTGSRHGGAGANIEAFTETQWVTVRGDLPQYPF